MKVITKVCQCCGNTYTMTAGTNKMYCPECRAKKVEADEIYANKRLNHRRAIMKGIPQIKRHSPMLRKLHREELGLSGNLYSLYFAADLTGNDRYVREWCLDKLEQLGLYNRNMTSAEAKYLAETEYPYPEELTRQIYVDRRKKRRS